MTLEERIEQEKLQIKESREELAYAAKLDNQHVFDVCIQNIEEHEQLAELLEELKSIREMDLSIPQHFTKEQSDWIKAYCVRKNIEFYNKALDDFIHACDKECGYYKGENKNLTRECMLMIAKKLKAGEKD